MLRIESKQKLNAIIRKSHKPIFYSPWMIENIKLTTLNWGKVRNHLKKWELEKHFGAN